jgi:glyoxylase-like metal-dependent hydrolase (beta-lactamase superfamily II)
VPFLFHLVFAFLAVTVLSCSHETELYETFAPVPAGAYPDITTQFGWQVEDFGGGVYMVIDGTFQALLAVNTHAVILMDAPPTIGRKIGYAISNITDFANHAFCLNSHSHSDHAGGAYLYTGKDVKIVAHAYTLQKLAQVPDTRQPIPTRIFDGNYTLQVGNQTLELSYKGENHELGNIFIYSKGSESPDAC